MPASYQITSNPDDSIDFEYGGVIAHIRGSKWQDNNDLAHRMGEYLQQRDSLREIKEMSRNIERRLSHVREKLSGMRDLIEDIEDLLEE